MTTLIPYLPLLGPLITAIVAGAVAFVVAVLSKELKTSEFRQAWIDGLRTDISEMASAAQMLAYAVTSKRASGKTPQEISDFLYEKHEDLVSIHTCHNRILLRLNPNEHANLIMAVTNLARFAPATITDEIIANSVNTILVESKAVLKSEWERVKRGEDVFQKTKKYSLRFAQASAAIAVIGIFHILIM